MAADPNVATTCAYLTASGTPNTTDSPRAVNACLQELRWLYDRHDIQEALRDLAAWIGKWQGKYPKLVDWVECVKSPMAYIGAFQFAESGFG